VPEKPAMTAAAPVVAPVVAKPAAAKDQPTEQAAATAPALLPPGSPQELELRRDSAHLLQLVQELKAELEKAGNDTLSLAAVRKADEIQKLSKSLKEKMKGWGLVAQGKGQ
jgi:hypothetical protein